MAPYGRMIAFVGKLSRSRTKDLPAWSNFFKQTAFGIVGIAVLTSGALLLRLDLATILPLFFLVIVAFSFTVADEKGYLTLLVFLRSALLVNRLFVREQSHARDAANQRRPMGRLYELSRRIQQLDLRLPPGAQLLPIIRDVFTIEAIAIYDSELGSLDVHGSLPADAREMAINTCYFEIDKDYDPLDFSRRVLRLGAAPIGALLISGRLDALTVDAIASLISITFDRYRSFASETKAAAARVGRFRFRTGGPRRADR